MRYFVIDFNFISEAIKGKKYVDCSEILRNNISFKNQDGVYTIYPDHTNAKRVYCDMTTSGGGWTVRTDVSFSRFTYRTLLWSLM